MWGMRANPKTPDDNDVKVEKYLGYVQCARSEKYQVKLHQVWKNRAFFPTCYNDRKETVKTVAIAIGVGMA